MDRDLKAILGVFCLVAGLFTGINYMVNNDSNANWLLLTVLFFVAAIFLFIWLRREDTRDTSTAKQARDALDDARRSLDRTSQSVAEAEQAVSARTGTAAAEAGHVATVEEAQERAAEMEAEAAAKAESEAAAKDDKPEQPVKERAKETVPEGEELAQDAQNGEPVAEKAVSEQSAATAESETDHSVTPDKVDEGDADDAPAGDGEPDDLTLIEGVGPYYRDLLHEIGVDTFAKLAQLSAEEIENRIVEAGGRRSASMKTWAEQAKYAAAGDFDGLEEFKSNLTGGRRT